MKRILIALSTIVFAAGLACAESCYFEFVSPALTEDSWVAPEWCTSEEHITNLKNGLSIFVDETGKLKTVWTMNYLKAGSDYCNPFGLLTRLLNAEWNLYEVVYHRDNITKPKDPSELDYASFVVGRSDDSYEPVCTYDYEASNPWPWGPTKLSKYFFEHTVPYRAATLVHEATHEDGGHVSRASICFSLIPSECWMNFSVACSIQYQECLNTIEPYWPWAMDQNNQPYDCKNSVDIGFGLWNAQTVGIEFMLKSMDTFLKSPETNELYIQRYTDGYGIPNGECGYVPLIGGYSYDQLKGTLDFKSKVCFLITPDDPARSDFWIKFFNEHWNVDYTQLKSNVIVAPPWEPRFPCDMPCYPWDYHYPWTYYSPSKGNFACNEDYQPDNASINEYNFNLCQQINNGLPPQFILADVAKAADLFEHNKKQCISGVSAQYLDKFCDSLIAASPTLLALETNFKIEDASGYFVPDYAIAWCEMNYCKERFDSSWTQTAKDNCYHWDDPLGCSKHLCGELGNDPTDFENFKKLLCRKGYFDNKGEPKDYMSKDGGKCDQDYMDCIAQEAFETWKSSEECTLRDPPGGPYTYIAHLPQLHALNLAASEVSYASYKEMCPSCQLHSCEMKQASCTRLMKEIASHLSDFLTHTTIPKQIVMKEPGKPTGPSIDPVIKPIERSLKTIAEIVASPPGNRVGHEGIVDQFLKVPEYQHASARALGHGAFFSIVGTKGLQNVFPKETLALYENASLHFDFDLNPQQRELLPALTEISTTRRRIEAPATLSSFATLATSNPAGMFDFVQKMSRSNNVREINTVLDSLSVTPPQPPAAPTLLSPANGATGLSANPTLSWNSSPGATSYRLQVSTSASFSSILKDVSGISGTSTGVELAQGTTYFWRVSASNTQGTSSWSTFWSFTTVTAPQPPTLLSPANGAKNISTSPTLSWNASSGVTTYRLQVATDNTFKTVVYDQAGITGTSQHVTGLHGGKLHYWRCNGSNSAGTSQWSNVWSFTTGR